MRTRPATLVFFVVLALLAVTQGTRFVLTNDEGILLDPAQHVAAGARPYVDFFGYMSPGSYWIQGALFKLFGVSLWVGRIPVLVDFSLQCALLFWLTARLASQRAALAAVIIFLGFQIADPAFLTAQHRWDSSTLAMAALCVALRFPSTGGSVVSGALQAAAAWCTPSLALVGAAQTLWLCWTPDRRRKVVPFLSGVLGITALAAAGLAAQGSLLPFFRQMLWLQRNYAAVNVMPYGSVIGGYARLFAGTSGLESFLRLIFVICLLLPALVPPASLLLWGIAYRQGKAPPAARAEIALLSLGVVAFALSAFPRADLFHLALVAALPTALTAAACARLFPVRAGAMLAFTLMPLAIVFSLNDLSGAITTRRIASPAGKVRASLDVAPSLASLLAVVQPGQTLYVHPYMPIFYFLTQGRNPTRFSFLSPGMMTSVEEAEALTSLRGQPPQWLLYLRVPDDEFKRVFPNAKNVNVRFAAIESWFDKNYTPQQPAVDVGGYQLYRRITQP